jgi:hypothetical protein
VNPQAPVAAKHGALNSIPAFLSTEGPVREVRFKYAADGSRDGGVHELFTIRGRADAPGCPIEQPDFETAAEADKSLFSHTDSTVRRRGFHSGAVRNSSGPASPCTISSASPGPIRCNSRSEKRFTTLFASISLEAAAVFSDGV